MWRAALHCRRLTQTYIFILRFCLLTPAAARAYYSAARREERHAGNEPPAASERNDPSAHQVPGRRPPPAAPPPPPVAPAVRLGMGANGAGSGFAIGVMVALPGRPAPAAGATEAAAASELRSSGGGSGAAMVRYVSSCACSLSACARLACKARRAGPGGRRAAECRGTFCAQQRQQGERRLRSCQGELRPCGPSASRYGKLTDYAGGAGQGARKGKGGVGVRVHGGKYGHDRCNAGLGAPGAGPGGAQ